MKLLFISITALLFFTSTQNISLGNPPEIQDSSKTCIVSGQTLDENSITYLYLNESLELCCEVCVKAFEKEPAKYLSGNLLCPVCDDYDGNKEISAVHNKVKYYFCNNGCKEQFESSPDEVLGKYNSGKDEK